MNCGSCGNVCTVAGQSCVAGKCTCPPEQTDVCNGVCTDLRSDPSNCGVCGQTCSGGTPQCLNGACAAPPDVLVPSQSKPYGITVDSTSIYWTTDVAAGAVTKADLSGALPGTLAANQSYPREIVSDGKTLFWNAGSTSVGAVSVGGGAVTLTQPTNYPVSGLTLYGSTLFFLSGWSGGTGDENNFVFSMSTPGGAATQITCCYAELGHALVTDGTYVYWAVEEVIDRATISPPLATPTQASSNSDNQWAVAMVRDGSTVYRLNQDGSISAIPGDTVIAPSSHDISNDSFMAVSQGYLYWTDGRSPGTVRKVAVTGGTVITLANHQDHPAGIAVDSQHVYWANHSATGAVMRTAR
jgi:hypothetical protein